MTVEEKIETLINNLTDVGDAYSVASFRSLGHATQTGDSHLELTIFDVAKFSGGPAGAAEAVGNYIYIYVFFYRSVIQHRQVIVTWN